MRVTIDLDSKSRIKLYWSVFKGILLCRKFPDVIRNSSGGRGYHIIWRGLNISEEQMFKYREWIGDDPNRLYLDRSSNRVKQILFTKKEVKFYESKNS